MRSGWATLGLVPSVTLRVIKGRLRRIGCAQNMGVCPLTKLACAWRESVRFIVVKYAIHGWNGREVGRWNTVQND